ncbi:hypothetical protein N7495_008351 [Penicillium taxi]|uniref:uncharacterized protein n=1 Tax=Penicillium taxi TaxID=168475 RepID=UPI0025456FAA|nr:uncharacterized protein N7495_008351 [Penicillium taxi]KAJ5888310.1 hypothetical protein N7495_008351 [Penicillium taxi]
MPTTLLSHDIDDSIPKGVHDIAIAELVLFSVIHIIQIPMRYMQESRYWHHNKKPHPARCFFYCWWSMVGLLAQVRIASAAMIVSTSHPSQAMLIAEINLQSVGLSPLLFEVSLVLLRCGQTGEYGPGKSRYSKLQRFAIHAFRFPVFVAIVLAVAGGSIEMHTLSEAGSMVLVVTFAFVCGLVVWFVLKSRSILPVRGHHGILLISLTLPFLCVRIIYFLLLEYGPPRFNPASGDVGVLAGMGLLMEVIIVILLLATRAIIEPMRLTEMEDYITPIDIEGSAN